MLEKYVEYADAVVGRFGVKPDGSKTPNVRTVARPLLNLFVGEPGGRKWRHLMDVALLKKPATVAEVVQVGASHSLVLQRRALFSMRYAMARAL